jgi:hypothetical protein
MQVFVSVDYCYILLKCDFRKILLHYVKVLISENSKEIMLKAVRIEFFFILKVANIRCFILIAVAIFHNIIRK